MSGNIQFVQSMIAMSSSETASMKTESGSNEVRQGETKRKELQVKIDKKMEEIEDLSKELTDASDQSTLESFGNWLTGSDGGVGELQDQIQSATAEMKKAQQGLKVQQAKLEMELQELQAAHSEMGERSGQSQKTWDERDKVVGQSVS